MSKNTMEETFFLKRISVSISTGLRSMQTCTAAAPTACADEQPRLPAVGPHGQNNKWNILKWYAYRQVLQDYGC